MKSGNVVTWQRYSGDVFARVLAATKRTVTLDVCGVRVTVARGEGVNYLMPRTPLRRDDDFAPHRLCAHIVGCIDGVSQTLRWAAADALATLPPLTERGHDRAFDVVDRALQGIAAQPAATRMAFVIALTYHLHEHTPATRPWRTLREKIDRACDAIGEAQVLAQDEAAEALYRELYAEAVT